MYNEDYPPSALGPNVYITDESDPNFAPKIGILTAYAGIEAEDLEKLRDLRDAIEDGYRMIEENLSGYYDKIEAEIVAGSHSGYDLVSFASKEHSYISHNIENLERDQGLVHVKEPGEPHRVSSNWSIKGPEIQPVNVEELLVKAVAECLDVFAREPNLPAEAQDRQNSSKPTERRRRLGLF